MTNQYTDISAYFQRLSAEYTPIGHSQEAPRFFQNTLDSIQRDLLPPGAVIMYLSDQQYTAAEQDGSGVLSPIVRISVLESYEMENYAAEKAAIQNSFGHIKQLMAKIIEDRRAESDIPRSFNLDDCSIFMETPINDRWIGCTLTFTLRLDEAFVKTAALWL